MTDSQTAYPKYLKSKNKGMIFYKYFASAFSFAVFFQDTWEK